MGTPAANADPEEEISLEVEKVLLEKLKARIQRSAAWSGLFKECSVVTVEPDQLQEWLLTRKEQKEFRLKAHQLNNLLAEHDSVFDHVNIRLGYRLRKIKEDIDQLLKEKENPSIEEQPEKRAPSRAKKPSTEPQRERFPSTASVPIIKPVPFGVDEMAVENLLLSHATSLELKAIGIYGVKGVGKTTLAQNIFHMEKVRSTFVPRIWVCLENLLDEYKQDSEEKSLMKRILQELGYEYDCESVKNMDSAAIHSELLKKRFLIVLDGASESLKRNREMKKMLRDALPRGTGGAVIVTGRAKNAVKEIVEGEASAVHRLLPQVDNPELCWMAYKVAAEEKVADVKNEKQKVMNEEEQKVKNEVVQISAGLPEAAALLGTIKRRENQRKNQKVKNEEKQKVKNEEEHKVMTEEEQKVMNQVVQRSADCPWRLRCWGF